MKDSRSPNFKIMQRRYKKIISLILLAFLCVFNLALPLPSKAVNSGDCSMRCHCGHAMKSCCCCKKGKLHDRKSGTPPCITPPGCMDDEVEGIICHGLSHITVLPGDANPSVFLTAGLHAHSYDIFRQSVYSKAIEKPPRHS
jgi:hypothetical protein